jgi:hypothetical protein
LDRALPDVGVLHRNMWELFNVNFDANLILFLRLSSCPSVGENTLIILKCVITQKMRHQLYACHITPLFYCHHSGVWRHIYIYICATPPNEPHQCILTHFNNCNFSKAQMVCFLMMVFHTETCGSFLM